MFGLVRGFLRRTQPLLAKAKTPVVLPLSLFPLLQILIFVMTPLCVRGKPFCKLHLLPPLLSTDLVCSALSPSQPFPSQSETGGGSQGCTLRAVSLSLSVLVAALKLDLSLPGGNMSAGRYTHPCL